MEVTSVGLLAARGSSGGAQRYGGTIQMNRSRERVRRALSTVALGCASLVLVATSSVDSDTTSADFAFDAVALDGRSEVLEGTIGPRGDLPPGWNDRRTVTVEVTAQGREMLLLEVLDPSGAVLASSASRGPTHLVAAITRCADVPCGDTVRYRIQSLEGGELTVATAVAIEFEASKRDQPDVEVAAPAPSIAPRAGPARSAVLATTSLATTSVDPVAAALVTWTSEDCVELRPPRLALVGVVSPGSDWRVMTPDRLTADDYQWGNDDEVAFFDDPVTQELDTDCRAKPDGRVTHSGWAVLHNLSGRAEAEIAVIGRPGHGAVRIVPASVEVSPVRVVRGDRPREVRHDVAFTGDPANPPDPLPVYLLAAEAPFQTPDLASIAGVDGCGQCASLEISVDLGALGQETGEVLEARVLLYEISVP